MALNDFLKDKKRYFELRQNINATKLLGGDCYAVTKANAPDVKACKELERMYPQLRELWDTATDEMIDAVIKGADLGYDPTPLFYHKSGCRCQECAD